MIDLKNRRLELGLTLEEVGDLVGVGKSTVRKWENGMIDNMKRDKIALLAQALKISPLQLLSNDYTDSLNNDINLIYNQLTTDNQNDVYNYAEAKLDEQNNLINLADRVEEEPAEYITSSLYGTLSAGTGQMIYDNPVDEVEIPTAIIPNEPYDIMLKIVGDSMQPAFKDGEYVFVKLTKDIRSGQFAAIIVNGEAYLKKVYIEDDQLRLVSLNEDYKDIIVNDNCDIDVVGTIVL
ncbi:helix-turn-helix domain-containing protein [Hutsoniella sourekii]|uniref:helix-turn-helix domain-containing protein n=1 Tax=Hutsoniella sourekii TaxID=87650 RepID=UPI0004BCBA24|nr:XRE family transcriptional regulator [Hutsoniella sourekii]